MRLKTLFATALLAACAAVAPAQAVSQTSAPTDAAGEQKARDLLSQMVIAMGGDGWLNRHDWVFEGQFGSFYRGQPTGSVVVFWDFHRQLGGPDTEEERIEYTKKRDIVQMFTAKSADEITFRGKVPLPDDVSQDYFRRRTHTIETVLHDWLPQKGTMVVFEGTTMVQRRVADKVTVISPTNDAVTIELDANSHLPLARTYQYRNEKYRDFDVDREEYDGYHPVQGIQTAYTITRFKNGDMVSQKFYTDVKYNQNLSPELFDIQATIAARQKVGKKK
ncbi:hypothetical protein [Terriglobus tenax]|uniref:hypothetical protein n=1 Tax=Terriglobus tenax TaxID=1111115 RepID=UPI0021DF8387|nr:hypothetical protein [Terriglobus tenax]